MDKKLRKLKDAAIEQVSKGKYTKALKLFREIAKYEEDDPHWLIKIGEMHKKIGENQAALESFEQAAKLYAGQGFLLKAIAMCQMILGIDPDHTETQTMLAELYANKPPPGKNSLRLAAVGTRKTAPPIQSKAMKSVEISHSQASQTKLESQKPKPIDLPSSDAKEENFVIVQADGELVDKTISMHAQSQRVSVHASPSPSSDPLHLQPTLPPLEQASNQVTLPPLEQTSDQVATPMEPLEVPHSQPNLPAAPPTSHKPSSPPALDDPGPESVTIEIGELENKTDESTYINLNNEGASDAFASAEEPKKYRTIPPGATLDSVKLTDVFSESPQKGDVPGKTADDSDFVFTLPLEDDEIDIPIEEDLEEILIDDSELESAEVKPQMPQMPPTPLFSALDPKTLQSLIEKVNVNQFEPGDRIITQGEPGDLLYVLVEGEVVVLREGNPRLELTRLTEGAFFGEIAILTKYPRTTTVEAATSTTVLEISRTVVSEIVESYPPVLKVLLRFFRDRLIDTLVETSSLFAPFSKEERESLAKRFAFIEVAPGTELLSEGKMVQGLYILLSGDLSVSSARSGQRESLLTLKPGDMFGAAGMLSSKPSSMTISTSSKSWLLKLDRITFQEVIMTHPQVLAYVSELNDQLEGCDDLSLEMI